MDKGRLKQIAGICQVSAYFMLPLSYGNWPYIFYQVLRVVTCGAFLSLIPRTPILLSALALGMAVLFNPFLPFHFDRNVWAFIDLSAFLLIYFIGSKQRTELVEE
jgi:hypothetical protein